MGGITRPNPNNATIPIVFPYPLEVNGGITQKENRRYYFFITFPPPPEVTGGSYTSEP